MTNVAPPTVDYKAIYHLGALNQLATNITLWRKGKGFTSPEDIDGPVDDTIAKQITNADLMLGRIMLMVSELSEACEAVRKGDKEHFAEELADCVIRILDTCGACDIDIAEHVYRKMVVNESRPFKHGKSA